MTEKDEGPKPENRAVDSAGSAPLVKRGVEWFWRGAALARARAAYSPARERAELLASRARVSADLANVVQTSEPLKATHEAAASELYRQAAYWAACALAEKEAGTAPSHEQTPDWAALDPGLFTPPEEGVATPEALRELASKSFTHFAELSRDEQRRARLSLQALAQALLERADARGAALRETRSQRVRRLGLLLALVFAVVAGALWAKDARLARTELTAGKSWKASSIYAVGGCTSPEQLCEGNTGYFFHTSGSDPGPWIEFDLAAVTQISKVRIENREDCCKERAVPLAIEVSRDHENWQQVARRDAEFSNWDVVLTPVQARWVRLRVLRPAALHLHRVRIYP